MTASNHTVPFPSTSHEVLWHAATRALKAPSVHNTQPWRFVLSPDGAELEIQADFDRQLHVLDPRARQLMISCGCALLNARVAIEAAGFEPIVERLPNLATGDRELVARIRLGAQQPRPRSAILNRAIDRRHTNRRAFGLPSVSESRLAEWVELAAHEGASVYPVVTAAHRASVETLSMMADQIEQSDPAYLAEIDTWTTDDPRRPDGVQVATVPFGHKLQHVEPDTLPLRNFDVHGLGWLPANVYTAPEEYLLLFCSDDDDPLGWLRTGEALERVWLELTDDGLWASPLTQVIEVGLTRGQLQRALGRRQHPQLLLRVGLAPTAQETPRRDPRDVIIERQ